MSWQPEVCAEKVLDPGGSPGAARVMEVGLGQM